MGAHKGDGAAWGRRDAAQVHKNRARVRARMRWMPRFGSRGGLAVLGVIVVLAILLVWMVLAYNALVAKETSIEAQWAEGRGGTTREGRSRRRASIPRPAVYETAALPG